MAGLTASKGGSSFEVLEAGSYPARCYQMIHLGTALETINGKGKTINKVRISWELPTETKVFQEGEPERPYVVSRDFTLSLADKANLRAFLKNWRGVDFTPEELEAFDISKLIGAPCLLNITHRVSGENTYLDVSGVSKLPKGMECPEPINPPLLLTYDDENWRQEEFDALPEFIQKRMKISHEYLEKFPPEDTDASGRF